jgi:hypothetical protein
VRRIVHFCWRPFPALILVVIIGASPAALAQSVAAEIWFDIPAQPIASALNAYGAATGRMAAYNGNLARGRVSGAVKGRLTAAVALRLLLKDSGLLAQDITSDAFVVVARLDDAPVVTTPFNIGQNALSQQNAEERRYSGIIQGSINGALCGLREATAGNYRLAVSFRIGFAGEVLQPKLLSPTGDSQRDRAIIELLRGLSVGEIPPPRMAQPFTMVILPSSSGGILDCPLAKSVRNG